MMRTVGPAEVQLIIQKLGGFDPEVIRWNLIKDGPVERLEVRATKELFCQFSLEVEAGGGKDYGFYFGHGGLLETLNPDEYDPVQTAEAVMAGSVSERIWRLGQAFVVRAKTKLLLQDGRELFSDTTHLPWLWRLAPVLDLSYRSYPLSTKLS